MKIYLDNCSLQRPLDNKSQVRIALEAEAILSIIGLGQQSIVDLVHSDALLYEIERTPDVQRRLFATEALHGAKIHIRFTEHVVTRAKGFEQLGIKPLDALHVASAEAANARYFCTCDDRLIKRLKSVAGLAITVVTPLELIQEVLA